MLNIFYLGQLVHTAGAALLAAIFLYLSRGKGNRALNAAGVAWMFLALSLASLLLLSGRGLPYENFLFQYWKILFIVALITAARRMDHQNALARPLALTAVLGLPVSLAIVLWAKEGDFFNAVHAAILAVAWITVAILILGQPFDRPRKAFFGAPGADDGRVSGDVAVSYGLDAYGGHRPGFFLLYAGFYDLFLEMLFGIGLIIWGMEETEARLAVIHARALDDTRRRKRLALIDPLTEVYNRHFFDEIRPSLDREAAGGSIVLVDVDD